MIRKSGTTDEPLAVTVVTPISATVSGTVTVTGTVAISNTAFNTTVSNTLLNVTQYPNAIWTAISLAATSVQATTTRVSAGAGVKNVCTGLTVMLASNATTAPTAVSINASLIDGASAGTIYLWRGVLSLPNVAGAVSGIVRSGIWIPGSNSTQMTLEYNASAGTNTVQSVSMEGTTL